MVVTYKRLYMYFNFKTPKFLNYNTLKLNCFKTSNLYYIPVLFFSYFVVIRVSMNSKEFNDKVVSLSPKIFPMVARILDNREDARDAVQEVMMKLWEKRKELGKQDNLNGYVFLTAKNYCIDRLRINQRRINGSGNNLQAGLIDNIKIKEDVSMENRECYNLIINLINNLPDNQKEVILLRDVDGLEFDEIITLTGYKIENIRVWLSRARKRISRELTEIHSYERGTA